MADNYPVPPPPPQAHKPVPPPPPRMGGPAVSPISAPSAPASVPMTPPAPSTPMARPAAGSPPMAMPGMPGMGHPGPSALEQRIQEMEKRFHEQESTKQSLESQLDVLGKQLKEEHEKVLMQNLRAKEEEALSSRVEHQIRDMQEKLRREKHEQELLESRAKAENQLKDLERRLAEERESWMVALKQQLKERELVEQDVEKNLSRRLREVEERFQDEKNQWAAGLRTKDEEISQLRRQAQLDAESMKDAIAQKEEEMEQAHQDATERIRTAEREHQADNRGLQVQLDAAIRDNATWKAQVSMLQAQLQQEEARHQQERSRLQADAQRMEEDVKRDYVRRDQERTQYWETMLAQVRNEKELMRNEMHGLEQEIARIQKEFAEQARMLETERGRWKKEYDRGRAEGREETLQHLPEEFEKRRAADKNKWEQQHLGIVQQLKDQLKEALDSQKNIAAKMNMYVQERERVQADLQEEKTARDIQTKQMMQRLAELQIQESALHEELETKEKEALAHHETAERQAAELQSLREDKQALESFQAKAQAEVENAREEKSELLIYRTQAEKELDELRRQVKAMAQAQMEWKNTVVQLQTERNQRDQEWAEKEKTLTQTIADLEKAKAEAVAAVEKAVETVPQTAITASGPEAAKALTAIRQQMQEMQTLLTWLRPLKKQPFTPAA